MDDGSIYVGMQFPGITSRQDLDFPLYFRRLHSAAGIYQPARFRLILRVYGLFMSMWTSQSIVKEAQNEDSLSSIIGCRLSGKAAPGVLQTLESRLAISVSTSSCTSSRGSGEPKFYGRLTRRVR